MEIRSLSLSRFRNYEELEFVPSKGVNILLGGNAQGKSAIVEAVYLLATSKSHRTTRDQDLIRLGEENARVFAELSRSARPDVSVEVLLSRTEKKSVRIDKVRHDRVGDVIGQLNAVVFSTLDIDMVRGEPSLRRRFMDLEICQISPHYIFALGRYKRVLEQRNNLLKEIRTTGSAAGALDVWDTQLAGYGAAVMAKRAEFAGFLANSASAVYSQLAGGAEELSVSYKPTVENADLKEEGKLADRIAKALGARRDFDVQRGTTSVGPHRDDLTISVGGLPTRDFASQGQQRSAAVALKLAEIELMENASGEPPVLLLDDVTAELDEERRSRVIELTGGRCQTFVTTTRLDELGRATVDSAAVFEVRSGKVTAR